MVAGLSTPVKSVHHQLQLLKGGKTVVRDKSLPQAAVVGLSCLAYAVPAVVFYWKGDNFGAVLFTVVTIARQVIKLTESIGVAALSWCSTRSHP